MILSPYTTGNRTGVDMMAGVVIDGLETGKNAKQKNLEHDWRAWVKEYFPAFTTYDFADHHIEFWEWIWSIEKGTRPEAFVGIWPRGGAKSSSAEMACIALGAMQTRSYFWYCSETQEQADKHVATVGEYLEENRAIERDYPLVARRDVGVYGNVRGWRRNRLRAANGLIVDAIGLDTAQRGAKVMEKRPDFIVFDDIDGKHDSEKTILKKIERITMTILPAGSADSATLMIQNLIHPKSIFSQLANGTADFLHRRKVSGPFPAIRGLTVEQTDEGYKITGGDPVWEGQSVPIAEAQINDWGFTAFKSESQHDVQVPLGGIWDHYEFKHIAREKVPAIVQGCVWVDPAVTAKDDSDSHAIQVDGIAKSGTIYRFYSWERVTSPQDSIWRAIIKSFEYKFRTVGIETDQGGDTWQSVYREAWREVKECAEAIALIEKLRKRIRAGKDKKIDKTDMRKLRAELRAAESALKKMDEIKIGRVRPYAKGLTTGKILKPKFKQAKAGSGHGSKVERNERMLFDYERGRVVHVIGTHEYLEAALKRFPKTKPLDLADAAFWGWADLRGISKGIYF